jgi:hypothetical protein
VQRKKYAIFNFLLRFQTQEGNREAFRGPASTCRERNPPFLIFCSGSRPRREQGSI